MTAIFSGFWRACCSAAAKRGKKGIGIVNLNLRQPLKINHVGNVEYKNLERVKVKNLRNIRPHVADCGIAERNANVHLWSI